ncbi:MAG: flagellar biosynthesis protein FlhB [Candidatus Margulisbacteria bacterium]|nr:flagellar biosynthesis protein FlhB [Candidatus Margulisiibacteriota bacterium]
MADPSKTEKATPRRQQEARKKGNVAKSPEVGTAVTLLVAVILLKVGGKSLYKYFSFITQNYFTRLHEFEINSETVSSIFMEILFHILVIVLPIMVIFFSVVILSNLLQVGFLLTIEPIKPSFSKLNVIKGFKNLFSKTALATLFKSIAKIVFVGYLAFSTIRDNLPTIVNFFFQDMESNLMGVSAIALKILIKLTFAFILIAIMDYTFQRYNRNQKLKMSKQEIKDEYKRTEGDPIIKGAIRRKQMEMARRRMMSEIPKADVVITNPTHIAIAISYNAQKMRAPKVVGKGMNKIAEKIKELAKENNIPIVENPPVARALFKACEVDKEIPADLYSTVAEILTYVYKMNGKTFGI